MNVFEHLISLPQTTLDALYSDPWTVQAVFRSLPPLAKNYVLRLLFSDADVPVALIQAWVKPQGQSQHKAAMKRLLELKIFTEKERENILGYGSTVPKPGDKLVGMSKFFRDSLQRVISDNLEPPWKSTMKPDKRAPTLEVLESYTKKRWESILHFMIGAPIPDRDKPSPKVVSLLVSMGLMQVEGEDTLRITDKGFRFLLQDIYTQVWTFLLAYIESIQEQTDLKGVLSFLFQLSFLTLGKDYPIKELSEAQRTLLMDLKEFGLIYQRKGKEKESRRYYPTRLALSLASGKEYVLSSADSKGYIIVGTDYRLYAYTSSPLHILLLSLFTKLQYRLPNLVVGMLTRESIRTALINGITAQQILDFLEKNAHPQLRKAAAGLDAPLLPGIGEAPKLDPKGPAYLPIVPETIADEIRLWEADRNRVSYQPGVLYDHFPSADAFGKVEKYAKELGVLVWSNPPKQYLMVTEKGHELIRPFIKKNIS